jgi:hypothetical protein
MLSMSTKTEKRQKHGLNRHNTLQWHNRGLPFPQHPDNPPLRQKLNPRRLCQLPSKHQVCRQCRNINNRRRRRMALKSCSNKARKQVNSMVNLDATDREFRPRLPLLLKSHMIHLANRPPK